MRVNVKQPVANLAPIHVAGATELLPIQQRFQRLVFCALLGENQFYVNGEDLKTQIAALSRQLPFDVVVTEAVNARNFLGLRHVPLFLLCQLAARKDRGDFPFVDAIQAILRTPRDAMDLIALYFDGKRKPLPNSFKRAIAGQFNVWTPYQIAKYATLRNVALRLRDVMFLTHPVAGDNQELFKTLADDTIRAPDTWESLLSVRGANKCAVWEELLRNRRLGALALVRNLRNMNDVGVHHTLIRDALTAANARDVWPWQALAAAKSAPNFSDDLTALMLRGTQRMPVIPGKTRVLVDVSGSMAQGLSARGQMTRMDAAAGLATILRETCEDVDIGTFSNKVIFLNELPRDVRLADAIVGSQYHGNTYMAQAIDTAQKMGNADRLIVVTDEQSQDRLTSAVEMPLFVINVASVQRSADLGANVTRINGWSAGVVTWLANEISGKVFTPPVEEEDEG